MFSLKRVSLLVLFTGIGLAPLFSQTITITGTVNSSIEGEGPVPGASVQLKGASTGTITDVDGVYTINVPQDATTLVFSCVGMKQQEEEISGRTVIHVSMEPEIYSLDEVVITTAYEIKRAPRSTSALTQFVSGDKVNEVRQTNINNALSGKVSGIQFRGQSAVALDRTGSLRLRGDGGLGLGNSIPYVVDGIVLSNSGDINLNDIEDISVLSGPGASALLGTRGANGAIIVTTKKAGRSSGKKMDIEVNLGVMTSSAYIVPEFQNEYAGGGVDTLTPYLWEEGDPDEWKALDGKSYPDYQDDISWGPRMEGQEYIPWYSWYPGSRYTGTTASLVAQPDNVKDFYERGWTFNNNIALSKAGEDYDIRAFLGNISVQGQLPGTSLNKTTLSLKSSYDLGKRFTFSANVNFVTSLTNGEFNDNINNPSSGSFNAYFHRNIDMNKMKELRGLRTDEGIYASWNHKGPDFYDPDNPKEFYAAYWWYNPYTYFDNILLPSRSDRLFGNISLTYKIIEGLNAKITYRRQQNNGWDEEKYSTDLNDSQINAAAWWAQWKTKGYYYTSTAYSNQQNLEGLISFNRRISDFNINANAGIDFFNAISKANSANTVNGFITPNLYALSNSVDQPNVTNTRTEEKYRAIFLRGDIGYRDFLYGELTLRNDWYSSLPPSDNSILSKSFGAAFVFSDLLDISFLNFGKIRASWGEVPTAMDIYIYPGSQYTTNLYKWNDNFLMTTPDELVDSTIHGAVKTQKELGLDLRFLRNRLGFAATWWHGSEKDIPLEVSIAGYSGFNSRYLNTGEITKQGLDFTLNIKPVTNTNFSYELNTTFSYLIKNKVVKIADDIESFMVEGAGGVNWWTAPAISHKEGEEWGVLIGTGMQMWEGKPVLNEEGRYLDSIKSFGSVLPKITGGIQNSFKILRNITIVANFTYQVGGKYFSMSDMMGSRSGVTTRTAGLNDLGNPIRDPVLNPEDESATYVRGDKATPETGGIHIWGVDEITHEDVDYYIDAREYYLNNLEGSNIFDPYVHDLTYIKLRELSIGYNFPMEKMKGLGKYIQEMNISFTALNLWLIYSKTRDFDPSEIAYTGGEWSQYPGIRSFGINLKVKF